MMPVVAPRCGSDTGPSLTSASEAATIAFAAHARPVPILRSAGMGTRRHAPEETSCRR
jgi:hypothetical protein